MAIYPVPFVEITASIFVCSEALPLIRLEITKICPKLVCQPTLPMHQTFFPVPFIQCCSIINQCVAKAIPLSLSVPLAFVQIAI